MEQTIESLLETIDDLRVQAIEQREEYQTLSEERDELRKRLERTAEILATMGVIGNTPHEKYRFINA